MTYSGRSKGKDKKACQCVLCVSSGRTPPCWHKNKGTLQPAPLFIAQQATRTTAILDFSSVCSFFKLHVRATLFNVECKHADRHMKASRWTCLTVRVLHLSSVLCGLIYQIYSLMNLSCTSKVKRMFSPKTCGKQHSGVPLLLLLLSFHVAWCICKTIVFIFPIYLSQ